MSAGDPFGVKLELARAQHAMDLFQLALQVFNANCQRFAFEAAEAERENLHAALDANLDAFMAANRKLEAAG
jgi:hypothetical protein